MRFALSSALVGGALAGAFLLVVSCSKNETPPTPAAQAASVSVSSVGTGPTPTPPKGKGADVIPTGHGDLTITPIHHGTVAFAFGSVDVVVDPWSEVDLSQDPRVGFIFNRHEHQDHMDQKAIDAIKKASTV